MKVEMTSQAPKISMEQPDIEKPVKVTLDIPIFYNPRGEELQKVKSPLFCSEIFADLVLSVIESEFKKYEWGLVYLGIYNPRFARHIDGTPIVPIRWSNHAYGNAIDIKGIVENESFTKVKFIRTPIFFQIIDKIKEQIIISSNLPEIKHEGEWIHIGIWR